MGELFIQKGLTLPDACLTFQTSRSSGPGGQNVNKLNTRVTVILDTAACATLTDVQKKRIAQKLAAYTDKDGRVQVSSQRYRSQHANRQDALERLAAMIAQAIRPPVKRRKTKIPKAAIRKRLELKKHRAATKEQRSRKHFNEGD